ncbi:heavy-metal-associated domain-containing protein [Flavobacterium frigoris]|jgi:Cu+-exporting ATPase|uniref:Lead, cadmium, zinc and mercury transporting ATPase n=1 Tax=Flavobacterium frigoris (strain PS1) TaxID=1086011 RepID=H7FWJ7_FLAFP|nr:heavy metal-associated domain-containing protein [Flavobacterium frigoris]EIA07135.1 lead, cadmium, zinc and mercury transporting ATPase [Flavobacterium frigoris PS1]
MKHSYKITGMSCNGCRTKVETTLNAISGVEAIVTLEPAVAQITMEKHIPTSQIQEALTKAGNYTIEMENSNDTINETMENPKEKSCCCNNKK